MLHLIFYLQFSTWLWNIARGISGEEVEGRLLPKSHGSGKTFPGPQALKTIASVSVLLPPIHISRESCFICSTLFMNNVFVKKLM